MALVLIVDDLESVRRMLTFTLKYRHEVLEAVDGGEALELLHQHRPDIVILDVAMPVLGGLQACRLLRADPDLRDTGIIIISANANEDEARQAGADLFIPKPFSPAALLTAVDDLVQTRAAARRGDTA
jgi:CheY-like chemotaxis protein